MPPLQLQWPKLENIPQPNINVKELKTNPTLMTTPCSSYRLLSSIFLLRVLVWYPVLYWHLFVHQYLSLFCLPVSILFLGGFSPPPYFIKVETLESRVSKWNYVCLSTCTYSFQISNGMDTPCLVQMVTKLKDWHRLLPFIIKFQKFCLSKCKIILVFKYFY